MKRFFSLLAVVVLSACFSRPLLTKDGDPDWGVQVTWHGHSCFSLQDSLGRTIVMDPFDDTVGYGFLNLKADAMLISHNHFDHNYKRGVRARSQNFEVIESTGNSTVAGGVVVLGVPSSHDNVSGAIHGPNNIYVFTLGGIRFAHLGDIGQETWENWQISMIGLVDVVFVPVGGVTTVNAKQAAVLVKQLKPKVVFPMHYGKERFYPLDSVELFYPFFTKEQLINVSQSGIRLRRADMKEALHVYTLTSTPRNN